MTEVTPKRGRGLVWRLYAVGVVQFFLVALSALLIGYVVVKLPRWDAAAVSARLKPFSNDSAALARELHALRAQQGILISLYDDDAHVLISNVLPALAPPRWGGKRHPPPEGDDRPPPDGWPDPPPHGGPRPFEHGFGEPHLPFGGPHEHNHPPDTFARFDTNGHEGLLVARAEHGRPSPLPAVLTLIFGLLVVGLGALLTARWIARPLSQLSRMAVSLGKGDLHARSELIRSDEVGEVARAFDEMAERIQKLVQAEKELLANVAHELRTPLARIRVALEIAGEGDAATARASLAEIAVDLAELEILIDDVLTAARFELVDGKTSNAGFSLHLEPILARTIAERSAARFRVRHPERPFETHLAASAALVDADPVLLRRMLDNLLENAHKYSPEPGSLVSLKIFERGVNVCFEVSDHGQGISSEDLPRVFTAFFRSERSRSRGSGGVGLGLTLAQRLVHAHGGTLEVSSVLGRGSTFSALLPAYRDSAAEGP